MDPWKHRSEGMKCKSCMWFVPKARKDNTGVYDLGRCRRHAPTMNGYPVVFVNDWCGDHKLNEEYLAEPSFPEFKPTTIDPRYVQLGPR